MAQIGETLKKISAGAGDFCNPGNDIDWRMYGMIRVASTSQATLELGSPHDEIIRLAAEASGRKRSPNPDQAAMWIGAKAMYEVALRNEDPEPVEVFLGILQERYGSVPRSIAKNVLDSVVFNPSLPKRYKRSLVDLGSDVGVVRPSTSALFRVGDLYDAARESVRR